MGASINAQVKTRQPVRVSALASGSSGNAYLVEAAGVKLLFDAGLNAYRLEGYIRSLGVSIAELSAIFITHEHIDHIRGAGMLARRILARWLRRLSCRAAARLTWGR